MRYAALLAVAAAQENFTVFPVRCYLAGGASVELLEDTVTCWNRSMQVRNGSKAVLEGEAECLGNPICIHDHEQIRAHQRLFIYGGAGSIFACWFCASFIGLCNLPHEQNEQDRFMGKILTLHGFSRQFVGLNLCFMFLIVSMMTIDYGSPDPVTCEFNLSWYLGVNMTVRILLSLLMFLLMTAGLTACKIIWIMREMPSDSLLLPWQEAQRFAETVLRLEPCWMDRAVQMQSPASCWMWENSFVSETLEKMASGWQDKKGREFKMEVEIRPMDDFTLNVMRGQGGYFLIEVDGNRLVPDFNQTHQMHFTARTGHCGMDFFWSHFWPMFKWNVTMLGLCHAAWEASSDLEVLKLQKRCRLLPAEELRALCSAATMPSPGGQGAVPTDYASVQRVAEWRRRALQAAARCPGRDTDPTFIDEYMNEEDGPSWAYRGKDLKEEAEGLYAERWRGGTTCNEDWFRLIGKAEFWLAHAFLELNRREPGLGQPLECACEVLTAALCSGRLSESCAILRSCQQALEQELRRCLLAVDRVQLDRLNAACTPVRRTRRKSDQLRSLLTKDMKSCLIAHSSHALRIAVTMKEPQALAYALIEAYRLNGNVLREGHPLGQLAVEARHLYQTLVLERSVQHAGLAPSMLRQIFEQHSCVANGLRGAWAENVRSGSFQGDVQAFLDLIGATGSAPRSLASELEVVKVQYVEQMQSMQSYLARREELKVSVHPKCAGQVGEALTVGPLGPWTHSAIRRCQGVWADKAGHQLWLIAGEEVLSGASLVAETLLPEMQSVIRTEHGLMNFRALPWPHLLSRPDSGDSDSEVSLLWLVAQFSHSNRANAKQINGVFQDGDLNVIFWNSGHKDNSPTRWDRSPVLFGHWWLRGEEALLLPLETFLQAASLLDTLEQHHGRAAQHKSKMEAQVLEMRGQGVPNSYGAVLYWRGGFYPIWEERPGLGSHGHFRSTNFSGTVDKSNRRIEIVPDDIALGALVPFPERCCGFRRGITARLSPKPLDLNVNELYLLQGTRATPCEDPASLQLHLLSNNSGSSVGSGIYLTDSAVQADLCSEEHGNGLCAMLICRVCLGRIINQSEGERHDTTRRGSEYHSMKLSGDTNEWVVFDPAQCYVEYLVWYRRRYQMAEVLS